MRKTIIGLSALLLIIVIGLSARIAQASPLSFFATAVCPGRINFSFDGDEAYNYRVIAVDGQAHQIGESRLYGEAKVDGSFYLTDVGYGKTTIIWMQSTREFHPISIPVAYIIIDTACGGEAPPALMCIPVAANAPAAKTAPTSTDPTSLPTSNPPGNPPTNNPPTSVAPSGTPIPPTSVPPTVEPTVAPTQEPTQEATQEPTFAPTDEPTAAPTQEPTIVVTQAPTDEPTEQPTEVATTPAPTQEPTVVVTTPAPTEETPVPTEVTPTANPTDDDKDHGCPKEDRTEQDNGQDKDCGKHTGENHD